MQRLRECKNVFGARTNVSLLLILLTSALVNVVANAQTQHPTERHPNTAVLDARHTPSDQKAGFDPAALPNFSLFKECTVCPEMVVLPSGSFTMGSPEDEEGRWPSDFPQHTVDIGYRFAVGRFEVTWDEWQACATDGYCRAHGDDEGWGRGRRPVIHVSWNDIAGYSGTGPGFIAWMNSKVSGTPYRLLSEAEWEYAARGGTSGAFSFDGPITIDKANYDNNDTYGGSPGTGAPDQTVPVGAYPANPFGLFDVHGNVTELVQDCGGHYSEDTPADGSARVIGSFCHPLVARGGSWSSKPQGLRSAMRHSAGRSLRHETIGFRIARVIDHANDPNAQ